VLATERRQGEGPPQVGPEADPLGHIPRCSLGRTGGAEDTDVGGSAPCQQLSYPRPGERLHEAAARPSVSSCEAERSPRRMEQRAENASPPGHKTTHKLPSDGMSPAGLVDGEIYSIRAEGTQVTNITANNPTDPAAPPVGDIMPAWGRARRRHLTRVGSVVGRPAQSTSRTAPYARVWPADQLLGELNCPDSAGPAKPDPFARLEAHNQWFVAQDVRLDVNAVRKGPGKVFLLDDLVACHVTKLLCRLIEGDIEFSAFLSTSLHLQSVPRWPRQSRTFAQARPTTA